MASESAKKKRARISAAFSISTCGQARFLALLLYLSPFRAIRWFTVENGHPVDSTPSKTATFAAKNATAYLTFPKIFGEILITCKNSKKQDLTQQPSIAVFLLGLVARTDMLLAPSQSNICPSLARSRRCRPLLALVLFSRMFVLVWCWLWLAALTVTLAVWRACKLTSSYARL